jgi:hypothetical protein
MSTDFRLHRCRLGGFKFWGFKLYRFRLRRFRDRKRRDRHGLLGRTLGQLGLELFALGGLRRLGPGRLRRCRRRNRFGRNGRCRSLRRLDDLKPRQRGQRLDLVELRLLEHQWRGKRRRLTCHIRHRAGHGARRT